MLLLLFFLPVGPQRDHTKGEKVLSQLNFKMHTYKTSLGPYQKEGIGEGKKLYRMSALPVYKVQRAIMAKWGAHCAPIPKKQSFKIM